ncbi:DUF6435 family protein [Shewanella sp. HL-SH8]|jgi:cytochrome c553|uniref:DUF6435 family protein n=1 Tax=Shewanella TaxID=22 RepID=UPI001CF8E53C|nr:DUF6435 family protein [Shewanella glacialimarina]UCX04681.1 Lacal_2735 family protein [Shewanella glacialimarina]
MFSLFRQDPIKKLTKLYESKLEKAMHAQRNGDIKSYSMITAEAALIEAEISALENQKKPL